MTRVAEIMRSHCIVLERHPPLREAICPIRNKPTKLETAKAYELGKAIHEGCYLLKLTSGRLPTLRRPRSNGIAMLCRDSV